MKTLIVAINSKFIHSALAPWYLKAACGESCEDVLILEHTINEQPDDILSSIYMSKPDVVAFSCYIWNISLVLRLAAGLKKVLPATSIILGGPEVSYDSDSILKKHWFIDYVLSGEGEISFPNLIDYLKGKVSAEKQSGANSNRGCEKKLIDGLAYRKGDKVVINPPCLIQVLDDIPSPYTDEMISSLKNKIVYFETTRGCPFSCSYCLSSACDDTRYFSLERVFSDLDKLVSSGVKQVKFVDRTFNFNRKRAWEIVNHILSLNVKDCNFHFEVGADLFDHELLSLLEKAPLGMFQVEAGVQTTNKDSLRAVVRKTNLNKLFNNLKRLVQSGNVHVHADLIAGLPFENYDSFAKSFDDLYTVEPHQLQLGFLKFLKGTSLRRESLSLGYHFDDFPPYEIFSGRDISYDELIVLKGIAQLVDRYYNSGRFIFSLRYIIERQFQSPFRFFESFHSFQSEKGYLKVNIAPKELFKIFSEFVSFCMNSDEKAVFDEFLKLDFLASDNSGTLPMFMRGKADKAFNSKCYNFLKEQGNISNIIPDAVTIPTKELYKKMHFERFPMDPFDEGKTSHTVFLFNYISKNKVTKRYPFYRIEI